MGINFILPLIAGIVMTVILGTQVAPSLVENMKIAKVENRAISNQNLIKDAIVRYIKMEKKVPETLEELKTYGILKDYHESNIFGGGYSFEIDKEKGTLKIFTTISDDGASKYFSNSLKFPNKPNCVELNGDGTCKDNLWETFYLLDEETFKSISTPSTPTPPPPFGSIEDIEARFTKVAEVGKKFDESTLVGGEKDYIVNTGTNEVKEYVYDKPSDTWNETSTIINGIGGGGDGTNGKYGVWIKNIEVNGEMVEKVICDINPPSHNVLVINENTGLGEIVWIAPDSVLEIKRKIFNPSLSLVTTNITTPPIFEANKICTSNVTSMYNMFTGAMNFNQPLNRWDVSKVTNMSVMFNAAYIFNQDISSWDVSSVTDMIYMFKDAKTFNKPLNKWNVSKVINMSMMFYQATNFNNGEQPLNDWDVSNVTTMKQMFRATNFNQDISNWDVSNVTNMDGMFYNTTSFNQDLSTWCVSKILAEPPTFKDGATS